MAVLLKNDARNDGAPVSKKPAGRRQGEDPSDLATSGSGLDKYCKLITKWNKFDTSQSRETQVCGFIGGSETLIVRVPVERVAEA